LTSQSRECASATLPVAAANTRPILFLKYIYGGYLLDSGSPNL
jgi:hypothetical protein